MIGIQFPQDNFFVFPPKTFVKEKRRDTVSRNENAVKLNYIFGVFPGYPLG